MVSKQEAADYAESVGAHYCETSAKLGRGIDEAFNTMGKRLLHARGGASARGGGAASSRKSGRSPMVLIDDDPPTTGSSRSSCCS